MIKAPKIKVIISVFIALLVFFIYKDTNAASATISASTTSAYVGDYVGITVNYYATTWNITLSGSINDTEVGYNPNAVDISGSRTWQLNTSSPGTYTVSMSGDVSGTNDSDATPVGGSVTITITPRPTVINVPPSNPAPSNNTTNNDYQTPTNNTTSSEDNKSTNNKLKELTSDYGKIVKVDDNHYTLQIPSNIEEVTIKAIPEDNKATVTGDGKHKIKVGSNTIEMIITSESGEQNKISLIVTRKDTYYIEDLETVLQTSQEKEISFKITADSKITPNQLTSIKNSGKRITLDYYDKNNRLIYSWIIDGTKISNIEEMPTKVIFNSKYEKEIEKQLKDSDKIYLTLSSDTYPEGTKLRVYVGDKYKDNDKVKIYIYDKDTNKIKLLTTEKVKSGYIEFTVSKGSNYVLVREQETKEEKKSNSTIPLLFLGFSLIVLIMSILIYKKKTNQKKDK